MDSNQDKKNNNNSFNNRKEELDRKERELELREKRIVAMEEDLKLRKATLDMAIDFYMTTVLNVRHFIPFSKLFS